MGEGHGPDRIGQVMAGLGILLCLAMLIGFGSAVVGMGYPASVLVPVIIVLALTGIITIVGLSAVIYYVQKDINYDRKLAAMRKEDSIEH